MLPCISRPLKFAVASFLQPKCGSPFAAPVNSVAHNGVLRRFYRTDLRVSSLVRPAINTGWSYEAYKAG